jgi:scyllo-inositol 2-dehydrogenase (NAD+)
MTLRVGVVGTGVMGRRHAENVAALWPRARVVAVADARAEAAQAVAEALQCDWYADPRELLARTDIQAVVIVTNADTHASLAVEAAERGKDILVEKPLSLSVDEARRAVTAAERHGVRLQVGFMRRYDPAYRQAWESIQRGELGQPVLFSGISRDMQPPPRSYFASPSAGGIFIDSGIHDFDAARWLLGDEVDRVSATGAVVACHDLTDVQPIDVGVVTLRFKGGSLAVIQLYRNAVYGYDIRTEILGTKGAVVVGDLHRYPVQRMFPDGIRHDMSHAWLERFAEAYALEMADWVQRMSTDRPPAVTGEDGVRSVAIAVAAQDAFCTGQEQTLTL